MDDESEEDEEDTEDEEESENGLTAKSKDVFLCYAYYM